MAQIYKYRPRDIWELHATEFSALCARLDQLAKGA